MTCGKNIEVVRQECELHRGQSSLYVSLGKACVRSREAKRISGGDGFHTF